MYRFHNWHHELLGKSMKDATRLVDMIVVYRVTTLHRRAYPLFPDRFLREEVSLHVARTSGVLAQLPDISRFVERPQRWAMTGITASYRGDAHGSFSSMRVRKLICSVAFAGLRSISQAAYTTIPSSNFLMALLSISKL